MTSRPGRPPSRAARSRSSSITASRPERATIGAVSAPSPGPISTSASPGRGSKASTIPSITPPSTRKCWPNRLRATWRIAQRAPVTGSERRLAQLDVRARPQLARPLEIRRLKLLFAQDVARLLALLLEVERDLAPLDDLDQVDAEA